MDYTASTALMKKLELNPRNWTDQVIVAEALHRDLDISKSARNYIVLDDRKGRKFTWKSGFTNYNTVLAQRVALYKDVYSRLLADFGAPGTENAVFGPGEAGRAWLWAESLGKLVVKPVDGIHGRHVFVGVDNLQDFLKAFASVSSSGDGRVLVEKFYSGTEHRCLLVNHKLIAVTRRRPASVMGDGKQSVRQLVHEKNSKNRGYPHAKVHSKIELGSEASELLAEASLTLDSIIPEGQRVYLRRASNIHAGGDAIDATGDLSPEEIAQVEHASRAVTGGRIVGLDVLLPRAEGDDDLRVLEMNTNSMISIHHFPWEGKSRDVAGAVLDALFPATKRG